MSDDNQKATLEALLDFVSAEGRVCPEGLHWVRLYVLLPNTRRTKSGSWEPPLPLILGAWWGVTDEEQAERLKLHVEYAAAHGALDSVDHYLRGLPADAWHHGGHHD